LVSDGTIALSEKDIISIKIEDAFKKEGCSICTLIKEGEYRYFDSLLYEFVNDQYVREGLRRSKGFCNYHAWRLLEVSNQIIGEGGAGIGIIYRDLLDSFKSDLERLRKTVPVMRGRALKALGEKEELCPACELSREFEKGYLSTFVEHLEEDKFRTAYQRSDGLCRPHLTKLLRLAKSDFLRDIILDVELEKLRLLSFELGEFDRRRDYRYANEPKGKEQTSWARALKKHAGAKGMENAGR